MRREAGFEGQGKRERLWKELTLERVAGGSG